MQTKRNVYYAATIAILLALLLSSVLIIVAPVLAVTDLNAGWEEVGEGSATGGGISNDSHSSGGNSTAIAPDGTPYVAWNDDKAGDYEVYVLRWNGSSWEEVGTGSASSGGISDNTGDSIRPSMAFVPDGMPYIAWQDVSGGDSEIYVLRWNGSSWEEVGTGSASSGGISDNTGDSRRTSIAIAPDGTPYVAWQDDSSGDYEIYVRRWNGSSWEEIGTGSATGGGISDNSGGSEWPWLAVAPDGTPYVAWHDDSSGDSEIYVRRWNGSSWEEVGTGSATGGGISDNSGGSDYAPVAISPNGTPYIGWGDDSSGDYEIYVRRWNGSSWEEVGTGSASGGGISNNSGWSAGPSLAVTSDGTLTIAWTDDSGGNNETYVRRWNGSSWEEVGVGSAVGGGISDNSGSSVGPSLAIAPNGTLYASWEDQSGGNKEIYVRRWNADFVYASGTEFMADPDTPEVYPGDTVDVNLEIWNADSLYAAQAECGVDPVVLEPQSATFGDFFDPINRLIAANEISPTLGTWFGAISQQNPAEPLSGDGLFATLTLQAASPGTTTITCDPLFSDRDGFTQTVSFTPADITVLPYAAIAGSAMYQGRLDHANIEVTATGPVTRATLTDSDGDFELDELRAGDYTVTADAASYLPSCITTTVAAGDAATVGATTLVGGDVNDHIASDLVINIGDVTLLTANFGLSVPPGDPQADINADGVVNVQDLAILGGNYEVSGCQPW